MGQCSGSLSLTSGFQNLISGNPGPVLEPLNASYAYALSLLNAAIGDGLKVVRKVQAATTVTQTYDVRSITGDGEASATTFTTVRGIILVVDTAYATNVSVALNPKDGTTGLLEPWGSAYSATSYSTAYGPNASNKKLGSPIILVNNAGGWATDSTHKDINADPGSVATGWTLIIWGIG